MVPEERTIAEMRANPQERKRLLFQLAKTELEGRGYALKKQQSGGFLLLNGETEDVLAEFPDIETVGQKMALWGRRNAEIVKATGCKMPYDFDPDSNLPTVEHAAFLAQRSSKAHSAPALKVPTPTKPTQGKEYRDAHRR